MYLFLFSMYPVAHSRHFKSLKNEQFSSLVDQRQDFQSLARWKFSWHFWHNFGAAWISQLSTQSTVSNFKHFPKEMQQSGMHWEQLFWFKQNLQKVILLITGTHWPTWLMQKSRLHRRQVLFKDAIWQFVISYFSHPLSLGKQNMLQSHNKHSLLAEHFKHPFVHSDFTLSDKRSKIADKIFFIYNYNLYQLFDLNWIL